MRHGCLLGITIALVACGTDPVEGPEPILEPAAQAPAAAAGTPPEVARPYDESADAQAQIDAAVTASAADGKRVLLMFGANWCVWCRRLDWVLQNHPEVSRELASHWRLVHVDVGPRGSSTNRAVAQRYGDPLARGLPCLVVLDAAGAVAHVQETGSLETGERHDPARVTAFLAAWRDGQGS